MMQIRASKSWVPGLLLLLLWAGNAQAVPCQNNLPPSNPDSVYVDHGDGTVTDTRTGLMWKQCAEGLSGATCQTGSLQAFTWANALAHAEASTFASYTDWRLPNVKELSSLVEDCRVSPTINTNRFPNTLSSGFWSGSPFARRSNEAWLVVFANGYANGYDRSFDFRVRLVRGGSNKGETDAEAPPTAVSIQFDIQPPFSGEPGVLRGGLKLVKKVTTIVDVALYDQDSRIAQTSYFWTEGNADGWAFISSECQDRNGDVDFSSIKDGSLIGRFHVTSDVPFEIDLSSSPISGVDLTNCEGTSIVGTGTVTAISVNGTPVFP